jgi:solute carrier family 25 protein 38
MARCGYNMDLGQQLLSMDAYPPAYVEHNLPLVVLSGLVRNAELQPPPPVQQLLPGRAITTVSSDAPLVTGQRAEQLLQEFLAADGTNAPWSPRSASAAAKGSHGFRLRVVGRVRLAPSSPRSPRSPR